MFACLVKQTTEHQKGCWWYCWWCMELKTFNCPKSNLFVFCIVAQRRAPYWSALRSIHCVHVPTDFDGCCAMTISYWMQTICACAFLLIVLLIFFFLSILSRTYHHQSFYSFMWLKHEFVLHVLYNITLCLVPREKKKDEKIFAVKKH